MQARQSIQSMFAGLKELIDTISPQEFASSRSFLNSMIYATCKSQL
jgi:Holliday junction resolvasome RuvABC endonuclease subunit